MIDDIGLLTSYLLAQGTLTAQTSTRIWGGMNEPPASAGYTPAVGGGVAFNRLPSRYGAHEEHRVLANLYQFRSYGATPYAADVVNRALLDAFTGSQTYEIMYAEAEQTGQPVVDRDTGWHFVLSVWRVMLRQTG